jgi:hypothetical protein
MALPLRVNGSQPENRGSSHDGPPPAWVRRWYHCAGVEAAHWDTVTCILERVRSAPRMLHLRREGEDPRRVVVLVVLATSSAPCTLHIAPPTTYYNWYYIYILAYTDIRYPPPALLLPPRIDLTPPRILTSIMDILTNYFADPNILTALNPPRSRSPAATDACTTLLTIRYVMSVTHHECDAS